MFSSFAAHLFNESIYAGSHPAWGSQSSRVLEFLYSQGIKTIISLEIKNSQIIDEFTKKHGMQHILALQDIDITVEDFNAPKLIQLKVIVDFIIEAIAKEEKVFIHCRGGGGRTGTILAALYMAKTGSTAEEAFIYTRENYHPYAIETSCQRQVLNEFASFLRKRSDKKKS